MLSKSQRMGVFCVGLRNTTPSTPKLEFRICPTQNISTLKISKPNFLLLVNVWPYQEYPFLPRIATSDLTNAEYPYSLPPRLELLMEDLRTSNLTITEYPSSPELVLLMEDLETLDLNHTEYCSYLTLPRIPPSELELLMEDSVW